MEIYLIVTAILMAVSYKMAESYGRNVWGWSLSAILFGIFSVLILWVMGKTEAKKIEDNVRQMGNFQQMLKDTEFEAQLEK